MAIKVSKQGRDLLRDPLLNKSTGFSEEEKEQFHLYGLVPSASETLAEQSIRLSNVLSYLSPNQRIILELSRA